MDFPEHPDAVEERQLDAEMLAREEAEVSQAGGVMTSKTNEELLAEVLDETSSTMALSAAVVHAQTKLDESPDASGVMVRTSALRALLVALKAPAPRERYAPEVVPEALRRIKDRAEQLEAEGRPESEVTALRDMIEDLEKTSTETDPEVWELLDVLMNGGR